MSPSHPPAPPADPIALRAPRPGDLGWVVQQHGALYAGEYGFDQRFEGLVAGIVAEFVARFDPALERCWIADRGGVPVGCVFLVQKSPGEAQLRMLIVAPEARGLGLGGRLVDACIDFARACGYRRMVLWTNSCLLAARELYRQRGFVLDRSEPNHHFGQQLVGEYWSLEL